MTIRVHNKDNYDSAGCVLYDVDFEIADNTAFIIGLSPVQVEALSAVLAGSRSNQFASDLTAQNAGKSSTKNKSYNYTFKITKNIRIDINID